MSVRDVIDKARRRSALDCLVRILPTLAGYVFLMCLCFSALSGAALGANNPVRFIAEITIDDDGRNLHYPSIVFFDHMEEELFLVNGGSSRVVVYGPDYFPRVSIGAGRGVDAPRGVYVKDNGQVFVSQSRSATHPVPRLTILNGAFFIDREIPLDDIPEAENFSPGKLAVSREGLIYLAGETSRGVLVLDSEGTFLRRLQPMDMISDREAITAAALQFAEEETLAGKPENEDSASVVSLADIPEEFRPRSSQQQEESRSGPGLGPVRIRNVTIDSAGNIFLLSAETSKIYVYSADETFLFAFGEKGGTPRKLSQPRGLAIDEKRGLIYVADFMRHSILVYDLTGRYLFEFGGRGFGPGWFNFPSDLALNRQGHVIVSDLFNRRVQILEVEYAGGFPMFQGRRSVPPASPVVDPLEEEESALYDDRPGVPENDIEEGIMLHREKPGLPESGIKEEMVVEEWGQEPKEQEPDKQHPESRIQEPGESL